MFSFLKRSLRSAGRETSTTAFAHTQTADPAPGWTESASDLLNGADVVEIDGDFAVTVFLEHFADRYLPAAPAR